jgi:TolB-like protein
LYALVLRLLSGAAILLSMGWFVADGGFEPVITAIAGLIGLLTATRVDSGTELRASDAQGSLLEREHLGAVLVLPFEDLTPESDSSYLGAGIADELIARLSQIRGLRVINRTTSRKFMEEGADAAAALDQLGATFIVEGGVRRMNDQLRVTAQVTGTVEGNVLWSDSFEGSMLEVFDFQEVIAERTTEALDLRLTESEAGGLQDRPIKNPKAYDYYLRARYRIYEMSAESTGRALQELAYALEIEGENTELLKAFALATYQQVNIGALAPEEGLPRLTDYAERIAAIAPDHVGVPLIAGLASEHEGDTRRTVRYLRVARNRDVNDPDATFWLTIASLSTGQVALGRCLAREMAARDPLNAFPVFFDAYGAFFEGIPDDGLAQFHRSLELGGRDVPAILWGGIRLLCAVGDRQGAGSLLDDLRTRHPDAVFTSLSAAFLGGLDGNSAAGDLIEGAHLTWAEGVAEWAQFFGDLYAVLGDDEKAIEWLRHAYRAGFLNDEFIEKGDPFVASLRGRTDFAQLVRQMRSERVEFERSVETVRCAS